MEQQIDLKDTEVIIKTYKVRQAGRKGATVEVSVPKEVFEREARRFGLTIEEAVKQLVAIWRYNSFRGLHLSFELKEAKAEP